MSSSEALRPFTLIGSQELSASPDVFDYIGSTLIVISLNILNFICKEFFDLPSRKPEGKILSDDQHILMHMLDIQMGETSLSIMQFIVDRWGRYSDRYPSLSIFRKDFILDDETNHPITIRAYQLSKNSTSTIIFLHGTRLLFYDERTLTKKWQVVRLRFELGRGIRLTYTHKRGLCIGEHQFPRLDVSKPC